jgi:hypothetical protein
LAITPEQGAKKRFQSATALRQLDGTEFALSAFEMSCESWYRDQRHRDKRDKVIEEIHGSWIIL